jgi:hypothetical protein
LAPGSLWQNAASAKPPETFASPLDARFLRRFLGLEHQMFRLVSQGSLLPKCRSFPAIENGIGGDAGATDWLDGANHRRCA